MALLPDCESPLAESHLESRHGHAGYVELIYAAGNSALTYDEVHH